MVHVIFGRRKKLSLKIKNELVPLYKPEMEAF